MDNEQPTDTSNDSQENIEGQQNLQQGKIVSREITTEMKNAYLNYAMSVIVARALPDTRDGLKPVQRRIIYAMHDQGMAKSSRYQKCAAVIGEVLKKYHPHGDTSVYDALVRMAQSFSLRYPLIDGQGNFGSMDGDTAAAMRYTECRLEKIADPLLADIDKDTVDFAPNYSGDYLEPTVLPTCLPNLLLNGATGIAVGMATNIPPHNLSEVMEALIHVIDNPEQEPPIQGQLTTQTAYHFESSAGLEDIVKFIKGPDFPTGGEIFGRKDIINAYATGRGSIVMQAKTSIEETKGGGYRIIVHEVPYQVNKATLVAKIADLVKEKKVEGISDLRDESDRHGLRVVVDLKRGGNPQMVLNNLLKNTQLRTSFGINMVALVNNEPKVLTLKMILEEFIRHRQVVVTRRTIYLLGKAKEREHILLGLKIALDHLDEVIKTIRNSPTAEEAKVRLISNFKLSDIQAQAILDMQLRRLAAMERQKIEEELAQIQATIADYIALLSSIQRIREEVKEELLEIKERFSDKRRTKIHSNGLGEIADEELIKEEEVMVTLTSASYIKRLPIDTYKKQGRGGKGVKGAKLKEEDSVEDIRLANTHDDVYFFTDQGKVYTVKAWDIPESSRVAKGTPAVNLIRIAQDEKITAFITLPKNQTSRYFFFGTRQGMVKKTALDEFNNIRNSGIIAMGLKENDRLNWVTVTSGNDEIILTSQRGQAIRFKEEDVRSMGRAASGIKGMNIKEDDQLVSLQVVKQGQQGNSQIVTISKKGYGKRTALEHYRIQNRAGGGIRTMRINDKTGVMVDSRVVGNPEKEDPDLIVTSAQGQIIRLGAKELPLLSRDTSGVRVIRLDKSDVVTSFELVDARIMEEVEEEKEEEE
ncbi:DNA gyrase subunit A [candidate division WWE3 bacterium CG08_land_8_20_14_0_20_43_13]|uniref:DNA gyrase subunit A n=1 Tax=candidate division WWE3 bacterium CG08_land_8_20_14_0_20_43_13 TaxID=1975087 RepID=A0A2H0X731_UNCKA|nr:MAG: DNA gyrase subunit A [candidate division WWE3 bacterium CG08_land_8_20_14_0_20_43_13]